MKFLGSVAVTMTGMLHGKSVQNNMAHSGKLIKDAFAVIMGHGRLHRAIVRGKMFPQVSAKEIPNLKRPSVG